MPGWKEKAKRPLNDLSSGKCFRASHHRWLICCTHRTVLFYPVESGEIRFIIISPWWRTRIRWKKNNIVNSRPWSVGWGPTSEIIVIEIHHAFSSSSSPRIKQIGQEKKSRTWMIDFFVLLLPSTMTREGLQCRVREKISFRFVWIIQAWPNNEHIQMQRLPIFIKGNTRENGFFACTQRVRRCSICLFPLLHSITSIWKPCLLHWNDRRRQEELRSLTCSLIRRRRTSWRFRSIFFKVRRTSGPYISSRNFIKSVSKW